MAYKVYVTCDCCGEELFAITNKTVSITRAEKTARAHGWKVTPTGWFCSDCLWKTKPPPRPVEEVAENEAEGLQEYPIWP